MLFLNSKVGVILQLFRELVVRHCCRLLGQLEAVACAGNSCCTDIRKLILQHRQGLIRCVQQGRAALPGGLGSLYTAVHGLGLCGSVVVEVGVKQRILAGFHCHNITPIR